MCLVRPLASITDKELYEALRDYDGGEARHALLIDQGKVGIVVRIYKIGATSETMEGTQNIHWDESYHIYYSDGTHAYINKSGFRYLSYN